MTVTGPVLGPEDSEGVKLTLRSAVAVAVAAAGAVSPALGIGAALASEPAFALADHVVNKVRERSMRGALKTAQEAVERSGLTEEEFEARVTDSPGLDRLFVKTLQAAADTDYEVKRRMLAKALAEAARYPARIDDAVRVVESVKALESPHVEVLAVLVDANDSGQALALWTWPQLAKRVPHLAPALDSLLQTLGNSGLAKRTVASTTAMAVTVPGPVDVSPGPDEWTATDFGLRVLNDIRACEA